MIADRVDAADKHLWLYVNFKVRPEHGPARARAKELMNELDFATVDEASRAHADYLEKLGRHRFSLAPPGNGLDTHRAWESLYLGTLPLVQDSPVTRAFAGIRIMQQDGDWGGEEGVGERGAAVQLIPDGVLPMVIVDDWHLISLQVLDQVWNLALERPWAWHVLRLQSWRTAMRCIANRSGPCPGPDADAAQAGVAGETLA